MPAEFESGFFGNGERAWHGLGTVIPEDVVTAERALELAGLDWEVSPTTIFLEDRREIKSHFANVRDNDGAVLGVVGDRYKVVQNHEAFAFIDDLMDDSEAKFHTAGALRGGKQVWILARLPETIEIAGWEDEAVDPFILFANSHDGSSAVTVAATPIRVVCRNTLNLALGGARQRWSAQHRSQITGKMAEARHTLGLAFQYYAEFEKVGNELVRQKMTPAEFGDFLENLVPLQASTEDDSRAAKTVHEARAAITNIYRGADNLANVRNTAWAAVNAVAEYADHDKPIRAREDNRTERRWVNAMYDTSGLKNRALALVRS